MPQETLKERLPKALERIGRFLGSDQIALLKSREFVADIMAIHAAATEAAKEQILTRDQLAKEFNGDNETAKVVGAIIAWEIAIRRFIGRSYPGEISLEELARQFGRRITDQNHLDMTQEWFNWDKITKYLQYQKIDG